ARRPLRDLVQLNFNACAGTRRRLACRTCEPCRAHVLDAGHRSGSEQFQAGFAHQLFHKWIAYLYGAALLLRAFISQVLRSDRSAREAVPAGGRPDVEHRVADASGGAARDLLMAKHSKAECVHERVSLVAFVEVHFARDRRDSKAVAVMCDAADDAAEQAAVVENFLRWFAGGG